MRKTTLASLALATLAAPFQVSCDNTTEGQTTEDPGPPILEKILIQDEGAISGRNAATDLLDKEPPIPCSDREPCPPGDPYSHPLCNLKTHLCPHPLDPRETPPAIGTPVNFGGNQLRLVFNKQLDPGLFMTTPNLSIGGIGGSVLLDPTTVAVLDAAGKELPSEKYWDPTGTPADTSNLFTSPYGPALVVKPKVLLVPLTDYVIRLKPDLIHDARGQGLSKDANGDPVSEAYPFRTEGLGEAGGAAHDLIDFKRNPQIYDDHNGRAAIDVLDAYVIRTSTRYNPGSLKVTVKRKGEVVETVAMPANINNAALCPAAVGDSPTAIHIFRISGEQVLPWEAGEYTATIEAVSVDNPQAVFSFDAFGKTPYVDVPFAARPDVDKDQQFIAACAPSDAAASDSAMSCSKLPLPWQCIAARPTDMAVGFVPDFATSPDAGAGDGG